MKERPILFKSEMVRAILDGRKTQTRRIIKPQPPITVTRCSIVPMPAYGGSAVIWLGKDHIDPLNDMDYKARHPRGWECPHGRPGDRLWVRETHAILGDKKKHVIHFKADRENWPEKDCGWKPSIHMPRWASRITLEIKNIRIERLNEISQKDAFAEGVYENKWGYDWKSISGKNKVLGSPKFGFANLWIATGGDWYANPWVWVIEFKRVSS